MVGNRLKKKKVSVVIPCFDEKENILEMYARLKNVFKDFSTSYELLFIDNGSTDGSYEIFHSLAKKDPHVKIIIYSRNFGPHGAYAGGLFIAKGEAIICIDGDLQDPPELISKMIEKWQEGYDVVYGIRKNRKGNMMRKIFTIMYYRVLNKLSYIQIPLDAGDFALMDRKVVDCINSMSERNKYFTGLRAWVGFKQIGIPFDRQERVHGKTKFSLIDYFRWAIQSIFSFSYRPLEIISYLAIFVVFLIGIAICIYLLDFFFYPNNPRGFITLILVTLFLGGIQLLCMSIIGQYIGIIFENVKKRPDYIIKEIIENK